MAVVRKSVRTPETVQYVRVRLGTKYTKTKRAVWVRLYTCVLYVPYTNTF